MYSTLQRTEAQLATEQNSARRSSSLRTLVTHFSHLQLASMDPFGFETWPSFRPENYAYDISPRLFCYSFRILETQLVNTTVVAHDVVVAGNFNCWMRLQVRVHVALRQQYFGSPVGQIPDQLFQSYRERYLPQELVSLLDDVLVEHSNEIMDDMEVATSLHDDEDETNRAKSIVMPPTISKAMTTSYMDELYTLTEALRHHPNLRVISENELVIVNAL
jgi:hypothetical protein